MTIDRFAESSLTVSNESLKSRNQWLDCFRAIACLTVVLSHATKSTTPGGWTIGSYGVGLFCVLSGYLITSILIHNDINNKTINVIEFLKRRTLRIIPAYYAVLLGCTLLLRSGFFLRNHSLLVTKTLSDFPFFATLTQNASDGIAINHLWSISVEEQFYCLLPVFLLVVKGAMVRQTVLVATILALIPFLSLPSEHPYYCNAAFIPLICGTLLSINFSKFDLSARRLPTLAIIAVAFALFFISVACQACPYGPLCSAAFTLMVWTAVSKQKQSLYLVPLAYIGRISYGIYLIHYPVSLTMYWVLAHVHLEHFAPLSFVLTSCASIALASFSWRFFEQPIINLSPRIERKTAVVLGLISPLLIMLGVILHAMKTLKS